MNNYKKFEIAIFNWLKIKNEENPKFTFSVRQKANKGSELNYFIGTETSKYFSTTFWNIPVGYPGSASDLINLVFGFDNFNNYVYSIQFNQTKSPDNEQNELALELIRNCKKNIRISFDRFYENDESKKIEFFRVNGKTSYSRIEQLIIDANEDIEKIIPIVDREIQELKKKHPTFKAHRFSIEEQTKMLKKMEVRFKTYENIGKQIILIDDTKNNDLIKSKSINNPLNQILYGPPGTGKTFNTINKALSIIESKTENEINSEKREVLKNRFDEYINNGQIVFTTFHQSMSYEDFIEGIKPKIIEDADENKQVIYEVEDGIFKQIVESAKKERTFSKEVIEKYNFNDAWNDLVNESEMKFEDEKLLTLKIQTPNLGLDVVEVSEKGNLKLKPIYSKKSKVYTVSYDRTKKLHEVFPDLSIVKNIDKEFRAVIGGSNSTAYWSVLNYINNKINQSSKNINENIESRLLPHILIIDEINRGNVSQIFGELITLIEEDKRLGEDEKLEVTLPYSKKKFGVPSNLYIIGTMNTADRSVEALDTALRRRFNFSEMIPQSKLLSPSALYCQLLWKYQGVDWNDSEFVSEENKLFDFLQVSDELKSNRKSIWETMKKENNRANFSYFNSFTYTGINLQAILETINNRIEVLLDRDHLIGHAYFINIKTEIQLLDIFKNKIIPLLQEYFYNDYQKIALVLGEGFVSCLEIKDHNQIFAKFSKSLDFPTIEQKFELIEEINLSTAIKSLLNLE